MPAISKSADTASIGRNAVFSLIGQLTGAAFTAGLTIFLARYLGTRSYGILTLALGVAGLLVIPADGGISNSVARFVAEHRGERKLAAAVVRDGLRLKLLVAVVVAALLFALAPTIAAGYGLHGLSWPLRGAALTLLGQNVMFLGVVFVASARTELQWWTALIESAVEATATVALVLAGAGAAGAAFGQAIGYLAAGVATLVLLAAMLGGEVLPRGPRLGPHARRIAAYGSLLLLIDGAYTVFAQLDGLIIGADMHPAAVGIFNAPMRLTTFLAYPGSALAAGVAPRLVRGPGVEPNVRAFAAALRVLLILQSAITALVLGWSALIVEVTLGGRYGASATALRELAPYVFLSGFGSLVSVSANYLGEARRRLPVAFATVILNVVLDLVLVPRIGVAGACVGTDAAFALYALAHLRICGQVLAVPLRPMLRTVVRSLAAGAAMLAVMLVFGGAWDHLASSVAGLLLGSLAFLAVLTLTRELRQADVERVVARLRSRGLARSTG